MFNEMGIIIIFKWINCLSKFNVADSPTCVQL